MCSTYTLYIRSYGLVDLDNHHPEFVDLTHRFDRSGCWHAKNLLTEKYCESWWTLGQHATRKLTAGSPRNPPLEIRKIIWTKPPPWLLVQNVSFQGCFWGLQGWWKYPGRTPNRWPKMTCESNDITFYVFMLVGNIKEDKEHGYLQF